MNFRKNVGYTFALPDVNPVDSTLWTPTDGDTPMQIISQQCVATTVDDSSGSLYTAFDWPANQWAEIQVNQLIDESSGFSLLVRSGLGMNPDSYFLFVGGPFGDGLGFLGIIKDFEGEQTTLLEFDTFSISMGDIFRIGVFEDQILTFQNGQPITDAIQDDDVIAGAVGIDFDDGTLVTDVQLNNFSGGTIAQSAQGGDNGALLAAFCGGAL